MSMSREMRNELFKYRKRKNISLDGSVPGAPYNPLRRSRRYVSGMPYRPGSSGSPHDSYMGNNPREYRPSLNAPSVDWNEYDAYKPAGMHPVRTNKNLHTPNSFDFDGQPIPGRLTVPRDDLTFDEQFFQAMGMRDEIETISLEQQPRINLQGQDLTNPAEIGTQLTDGVFDSDFPNNNNERKDTRWLIDTGPAMIAELAPEDIARRLSDLIDAHGHLQKAFSGDHDDVVNLRAAISDIIRNPEAMSKLETLAGEDRPSNLGGGNPYTNDELDEYPDLPVLQQDMPVMFDEMEHAARHLGDDMALVDDFIDEQNLEQIIESDTAAFAPQPQFVQDDMMQMMDVAGSEMAGPMEQNFGPESAAVFDEIDQAIDQAIDQVTGQPMQYDPMMAQQYMFEPEYMQQLMMSGGMPFNPMGPQPMPGMMPGP